MEVLVKGESVQLTNEQVVEMKMDALIKSERFMELIVNDHLRSVARRFFLEAPDYFFVIPASSSGKYHWATELGGLVDHVLMGMHCAHELARTFGLSRRETDLAIVAMAGHDCLKYGIDYGYEYHDMHPFLPRSYYKRRLDDLLTNPAELDIIFNAIERHMGNIANGDWTSVGRIKPDTYLEQVVHLADFMASRKDIRLTTL
jgi:hypothetical protein